MTKKLEDNVFWESSRMIIPQHKEQALKQERESIRKQRPELDEQRLQDLAYRIGEAMSMHDPVTIVVFGEIEDMEITGTIDLVDQLQRRIKVVFDDDWEWVKLEDVMEIK